MSDEKVGNQVVKDIDWEDFRDHIPTADKDGRRMWLYPRKPKGTLYTARKLVSYVLLIVLCIGPFVKINGNPLLMANIPARQFSIFGQLFWPQDMFIFAIAALLGMVAVVLSTAVYGRIWCGWLCPQTVFMEMVFRRIEYLIEGDAAAQRRLDAEPWNGAKILRKGIKWIVFFLLSFVVANLLLGYIIGGDALITLVTDSPLNHPQGFTILTLFTFLFFGIFARFREQACTFVCPYGRLQSVLLDDSSVVISYDHKRGEGRASPSVGENREARQEAGKGDCVDCGLCVAVCPTGIDIRNGTQLECVNCTACIDACDSIMDRMKFPRGLVRYASLNGINKGEKLKLTPRMVIYTVVLTLLTAALALLIFSRADVQTTMQRSRGTMFTELPTGEVANLYMLKLRNKTGSDITLDVRLEAPEGTATLPGGSVSAEAREVTEFALLVSLPRNNLTGVSTPIEVGIYDGDRRLETLKSRFLGPAPQRKKGLGE